MFGPAAANYATSKVHANSEELARLVELVAPRPTDRVLDIATGTGNTAFAFAPFVAEVVAYDLTPGMLEQVRIGAAERELTSVRPLLGDACAIPDTVTGFDIVVVRLAPHHFPSIDMFLAGCRRALCLGYQIL